MYLECAHHRYLSSVPGLEIHLTFLDDVSTFPVKPLSKTELCVAFWVASPLHQIANLGTIGGW